MSLLVINLLISLKECTQVVVRLKEVRSVCVTLIVLLVTVPHADALQAVARFNRHRGFLHRQSVVDGLVALVVQRAVQDALQPEVTVGLLLKVGKKKRRGGEGRGGR